MRRLLLLGLLLPTLGYSQEPSTGPVASPAPITVSEPSQFYSIGAGIQGLGPSQSFGYYSQSQRIATGTYATQITEFFRMPGGKVGQCARAGISKILWTFGPSGIFRIGAVGDAGACEGPTGSASGAIAERSFITWKIGKSGFHLIGSAEGLKVAGTGNNTIITFGAAWGF